MRRDQNTSRTVVASLDSRADDDHPGAFAYYISHKHVTTQNIVRGANIETSEIAAIDAEQDWDDAVAAMDGECLFRRMPKKHPAGAALCDPR